MKDINWIHIAFASSLSLAIGMAVVANVYRFSHPNFCAQGARS